MLRITEYGQRIRDEFIEHCHDLAKYDIAMDHGLEVLNDCVRGVKDYAALCILNYDTMAIDTVESWKVEASSESAGLLIGTTPTICLQLHLMHYSQS